MVVSPGQRQDAISGRQRDRSAVQSVPRPGYARRGRVARSAPAARLPRRLSSLAAPRGPPASAGGGSGSAARPTRREPVREHVAVRAERARVGARRPAAPLPVERAPGAARPAAAAFSAFHRLRRSSRRLLISVELISLSPVNKYLYFF